MKSKLTIVIKLFTAVIIWVILLLFSDFDNDVNTSIEKFYAAIKGESVPDSNIVIIHLSKDDIDKIGPWPIKRSYYALLIKSLTSQNVRKIGLEIFLSSRFVTQSIYENLLKNEILKSERTVLSSVAGNITKSDGQFVTDSLSYPSAKLIDEKIETGHINFIYENGIKIPAGVINKDIIEPAFSEKLIVSEFKENYLLINFICSWHKFKNYSVTEYFNLLQTNPSQLDFLKDKIVIVGVSDPQIANTFSSSFDSDLPGVSLHAFAVENILNSRYLRDSFYSFSVYLFIVLILLLIFLIGHSNEKIFLFYILTFIIFFVFSFSAVTLFYHKLAISFFFLPLISLFLIDTAQVLIRSKNKLKEFIDETDLLKSLLSKKEKELNVLQKEFDLSNDDSSQLTDRIKKLKDEIDRLKENENDSKPSKMETMENVQNFHGIVYRSIAMQKVVELINKSAPTDSTILIVGESGTGKELAAKAIHILSKRSENNFVAVNCGALNENLLESELFGHVKGSFTGAVADKPGKFEMADKGTILLDEIGETTENFQVKLLRVLQSGDIEKVGSTNSLKVDVRVVASTNKDLQNAVLEKKFREDLYYRVNVFRIELPPLRKRKEDIIVLADHFIKKSDSAMKISEAAEKALQGHEWKGNVRELESVISRAVILAKSVNRKLIQLSDLPDEIVKTSKYNFDELVLDSLRNKNFSHSAITETAKELGNVNRTMISENLRGVILKEFFETDYNLELTISNIASSTNQELLNKVRSKIEIVLENIEKDISKLNTNSFDEVRQKLAAKYKNLPVKFHKFLDEFIKKKLKDIN